MGPVLELNFRRGDFQGGTAGNHLLTQV